jgi:CheY-like chemotaxis protein
MRRVVIIDDEPAFAQTLTKMLSGLGYEVIVSPDASYAFDLRDEDIVFLDVLMPDTSGLQVLDQLAQHGSKSPHSPYERQPGAP